MPAEVDRSKASPQEKLAAVIKIKQTRTCLALPSGIFIKRRHATGSELNDTQRFSVGGEGFLF